MLRACTNSILEAVAANGLPFGRGAGEPMRQGDFRCDHGTCDTKLGEFVNGVLCIKYKGLRIEQRLAAGVVIITCPNCGWSRIWDASVSGPVSVEQPSSQDYYTTEEPKLEFPCPDCDFVAQNNAGLTSHRRHRHPKSL